MALALAFHKGEFVPLEEATVGVMTHALHYGTSVFEGIRGNWNPDHNKMYIFRLQEHLERLVRGSRILCMDLPYSVNQMADITVEVVERSGYTEDLYIRPIAYKATEMVANLNLRNLKDDLCILAIPFGRYIDNEGAISCCTSAWRRIDDSMIPPRVKLGGLYLNSILAKTDAMAAGFDEAIMLNLDGHVCEGTGENIFLVIGDTLVTPTLESNVLPGITRDTVIELARNELGIDTVERSVDRSELYLVDEIFLTGTAAHIQSVGQVDHRQVGTGDIGPVTKALQNLYFDVVRGKNPKYLHMCTSAKPPSKT